MVEDDSQKRVLEIAKDFAFAELIPGFTSILKSAVSSPGDMVQVFSNVLQGARKEGALSSWAREWEELVMKGRVDPNFTKTDIGQICFLEILDSLNKDQSDNKRFEALKAIFRKAAHPNSTEAEKVRIHHMMKACRELDAAEIIIMQTCFNRLKKTDMTVSKNVVTSADQWPHVVADLSKGLLSTGIVIRYEEKLISKNLIGPRIHSDRSGITNESTLRLTILAMELCELLEEK